MRNFSPRLARTASLLPDPVEAPPNLNKDQARKRLGIPLDGRIVSLTGLLENRKGVPELLQAFELAAPHLQPTDRILLAGKATTEIRALLENRYGHWLNTQRILFLNRHLTNIELWAACIAANLVCTPYPKHLFSASIVIRAARVGVPVLGNSIGWMQQTIPLFGLGSTCNTCSPEELATQLKTSLDASAQYRIGIAGQRFLEFHSPENFASRLTGRVAERLGCRSLRQEIHWEDVLPNPQPLLRSA